MFSLLLYFFFHLPFTVISPLTQSAKFVINLAETEDKFK